MKFKRLSESAVVPKRATEESAGLDLYVDTDRDEIIFPHSTKMFQTNIAVEIPEGCFGAVFPRSGISTKRGLNLANGVAVIDSDYRGGIGIPIHNNTNEKQTIRAYERVAQLVIIPYKKVELEEVYELTDTERGVGGFGSTGER